MTSNVHGGVNGHTGVIKPLEDLKRDFAPILNVNDVHKSRLSKGEKAALFITRHVGTMVFFYICLTIVVIPLFFPATLSIVQYISAGFLQLLLLPLILIAENLQGRHSELIAQHDYETTIKAEREIESILMHLEKQDELMLQILKMIETLEKK